MSTSPYERTVVVITGAGASRRLGSSRDLPVMREWSEILRRQLDSEEPGLARAVGLDMDATSEEFEAAIGALVAFQDSGLNSAVRFEALGHGNLLAEDEGFGKWAKMARDRTTRAVETLHRTLFDNFGAERIDQEKAQASYKRLMDLLGGRNARVCFATTNYDPSLEIALEGLDYQPNTGFIHSAYMGSTLASGEIISWADSGDSQSQDHFGKIPVLHLHGGVGWYWKDGRITFHSSRGEFNPSLGAPALLTPDPEKDPLRNPYVVGLWREFHAALQGASHVLVIGHSLHDEPLVDALRQHAGQARLCVTRNPNDPSGSAPKIRGEAPAVEEVSVPLEFGPDFVIEQVFDGWLRGRS